MLHYLHSEIGRQNTFSTLRWNNWNKKFPIGSLYEFISNQKFSGVPGQLIDHGAVNFSSTWDEVSYGRDCGHIFSLQCSLHEQWQLERNYCGKDLDSFCSLMNMFFKNLKAFSSSLLFFCMGSWLWSNIVWNP